MKEILDGLCRGQDLLFDEASDLFAHIIQGNVSEVELTALLIALKCKGEVSEEIAGAARALRDSALPFPKPDYEYIDTCGTGGDGLKTVNISTAAAFVLCALGVKVAKHGNVSVSSSCGSADVLRGLGARLELPPDQSRACMDEVGLCFLFAPQYHSGMRFAMPVRKALKVRTLFNLLGPLVNPSEPKAQVMGVYDRTLCAPLAHTLKKLGCSRAMVLHGSGLDEVALHGSTQVAHLKHGEVTEYEISPGDFGIKTTDISALAGGNPEQNAKWLLGLLGGKGSEAHKHAVAVNVSVALLMLEKTLSLQDGFKQAVEILSGDAGLLKLNAFVGFSKRAG